MILIRQIYYRLPMRHALLRVSVVVSMALIVAACQNGAGLDSYIESVRTEISGGSEAAESRVDEAAPEATATADQAGELQSEPKNLAGLPPGSEEINVANVEAESLAAPAPAVVRVALLVPLSGRYARQGSAILNAAQLALFDIGDDQFRLLPFDTGGTSDGAELAVLAALEAGASLLIGPLLREEVLAVAPHAKAANVRIIAFSTDPEVAGSGVYLIGHTSRQQVERVVNYAYLAGHRRFAALAPDTAYGRAVVSQYHKVLVSVGAELTRTAFYSADAADAAEVVRELANYDVRRAALEAEREALMEREDEISVRALTRLESLHTLGEVDFDAILIPDGGSRLRQVVSLVPFYDIEPAKVRLLGLGLWNTPQILAEPTLAGAWYVAPPPAAEGTFRRRYERAYDRLPLRIAELAYDATALAAALGRRDRRADFSDQALTTSRGFFGAAGAFRFMESGLSERGLAVLEVEAGGTVRVIDAPTRGFSAATAN
ncbi:MAG: penicillin-binding protein activator [Alphaproteobacteria bacterium]|jgi:branched-chain amino acid transport system substrate-binding protein|nr:penicillin-binding protein activator [Alphaproteobacteria bacterium]